ncbi:MAG: TIGR04255 family protein [Myxococcota bacterium]
MVKLADYESPPLIEVVFGVGFNAVDDLTGAHVGQYWTKIRNRFPTVKEAPPLSSDQIPYVTELPPRRRTWFVSEDETLLVQIQDDRFLLNWRTKPDANYPRFDSVRLQFEQELADFLSYLTSERLGAVVPTTYELTYVNHIVANDVDADFDELAKPLRYVPWQTTKSGFLPLPTNAMWRLVFPLPDSAGQLNVIVQQTKLIEGNLPLLKMVLTARGMGGKEQQAWFDLAHEWIVRGFEELTTEKAQQEVWRKQ